VLGVFECNEGLIAERKCKKTGKLRGLGREKNTGI
jgi:hypothetical protein